MKLAEELEIAAPSWLRPATKRDGSPWRPHLPDDGVLFSPQVEVFREGTNDGYGFSESVCGLAAVVSVAMPNCNTKMSDSPVDAHPEPEGIGKLMSRWCKGV